MDCRPGCAACCIAPSISSLIPGRDGQGPAAKAAGLPCVQLDDQLRCRLFGQATRPAVCRSLQPSVAMCGASRDEALQGLNRLEHATRP